MTDRDNSDFADEQLASPSPSELPADGDLDAPRRQDGTPGAPEEGQPPARPADGPPPARPSDGPPHPPRPGQPATPPWARQAGPPPAGNAGDPGAGQGQPGAERGPYPGAHRAGDPPTDWVTPPRAHRTEVPEWVVQADRTQPERAQPERPAAERPQAAERPRLDRPQGERPQVERPQVERPQGPPPRMVDTGTQQQQLPARWGVASQPAPPGPAAPSGDWSYVDSIRTSELVRTRKVPPERGWRRAVYHASFGLVNLGQSPAERRQAELDAKVRALLRGRYKIGVLGKGGVGKTSVAASVGSIFAALRPEDRVVAIDADTAFGKLASRIDPHASGSYWELAADDYLHSFADVRAHVGSNPAGLFVLAGEASTARRRVLDPAVYREATARLDNHFTISIIDCGSALDAPVTQEALRDLDALIVVSSPWVDGASAAAQTMEWLANRGLTHLLHRTVVVLNDSDGHADKRTRSVLVDQLGSRGQVVIEVPYDPHLRPGGVIDVDNELSRTARRRFLEIAAAIAEHFAATTDRPRERR